MHISAREEAGVPYGYFCLRFTMIRLEMGTSDPRPGEVAVKMRAYRGVRSTTVDKISVSIFFNDPCTLDDVDQLIDSIRGRTPRPGQAPKVQLDPARWPNKHKRLRTA